MASRANYNSASSESMQSTPFVTAEVSGAHHVTFMTEHFKLNGACEASDISSLGNSCIRPVALRVGGTLFNNLALELQIVISHSS